MFNPETNHLDRERKMFFYFQKIFLKMPRHIAMRPQSRKHIDEPKHLDFQRFVGHCGTENAVIPPSPLKHRGSTTRKVLPDIGSQTMRIRLKLFVIPDDRRNSSRGSNRILLSQRFRRRRFRCLGVDRFSSGLLGQGRIRAGQGNTEVELRIRSRLEDAYD